MERSEALAKQRGQKLKESFGEERFSRHRASVKHYDKEFKHKIASAKSHALKNKKKEVAGKMKYETKKAYHN